MSLRPHFILAAKAARLGLRQHDVGDFVRVIAAEPGHPGRRGLSWFLKRNGERIPLGQDLVTAERTLETIATEKSGVKNGKTRRQR